MKRKKKEPTLLSLLDNYKLDCNKGCFQCKWKALRTSSYNDFGCSLDIAIDLINAKENFPDYWEQHHG